MREICPLPTDDQFETMQLTTREVALYRELEQDCYYCGKENEKKQWNWPGATGYSWPMCASYRV